jgi:hypothetical protein
MIDILDVSLLFVRPSLRRGWSTKPAFRRTPWLPRAAPDTKLVREVQSGAAGSNQNSHEVVVAVAESGQLGKAAPVVDRGLDRRWLEKIASVNLGCTKMTPARLLGKIESCSKYAGIYKLRLYKSTNNGLCSPSSIS